MSDLQLWLMWLSSILLITCVTSYIAYKAYNIGYKIGYKNGKLRKSTYEKPVSDKPVLSEMEQAALKKKKQEAEIINDNFNKLFNFGIKEKTK